MKAVQLYIDSGCDEVVVLQTLGYPSPNALRQWYREYEQTGTLHPNVKFTTKDDYAMIAMVENGLGISIMPEVR